MRQLKLVFGMGILLMLTTSCALKVGTIIFPNEARGAYQLPVEKYQKIENSSHIYYYLRSHTTMPSHPLIIFLHGNGGLNGADTQPLDQIFDQGYDIALVPMRGYDGQGGYIDQNIVVSNFVEIVRQIRKDDIARQFEKNMLDRKIYVFGHSLGGAIALQSGSQIPVDGIVTLASFSKARDFAPDMDPEIFARNPFDNIAGIKKINKPLAITHCKNDPVIPFEMFTQLKKSAQDAHLPRFKAIEGNCAAHEVQVELILEALDWLKKYQ